jgi:hypothetical protein
METYPMPNLAQRLKGVWRKGGKTPRILNLGIWWRLVVSFTSQPLYSREKSSRYTLDRRAGGSQRRSGIKNLKACKTLDRRTLGSCIRFLLGVWIISAIFCAVLPNVQALPWADYRFKDPKNSFHGTASACILHRILLGWLNEGGLGGRDRWHAGMKEECLQGFIWESRREETNGKT